MRISIHDFRGVADFSATLDGILLIAGGNGAGKSSVCDAVGAALAGVLQPYGIAKKDAALLVRDGGSAATVQIATDDGGVHLAWPSCDRSERGIAPRASRVAAGIDNPLAMTAKERASWLIGLLGAEPALDDLREAVVTAGGDTAKADEVAQDVQNRGWDGAHADAKEAGAKLKGQWERVTGQRYGVAKAAAWRPEAWRSALEAASVDDLRAEADRAAAAVEDLRKKVLQSEGKVAEARETIARAQKARSELAHAKGEMAKAKRDADAAQSALDALAPPAEALHDCPCCGEALAVIGGELVRRPAQTASAHEASEARRAVQQRGGDLRTAQAKVERMESEIAKQPSAEAVLAETGDAIDPRRIADLKQKSADAAAAMRAKQAAIEASSLHERIGIQAAIVKLLAEDGLRQKALAAGLGRLNETLQMLCQAADWPDIAVDDDLAVYFGDRPVALVSTGQRYRARAALQIAAAMFDASALVILDGADVLDRPGRNGLFKLACRVPTLIGMTLKQDEMPPLRRAGIGDAVWIEAASAEAVAA